jgi:hypothetical protein
MKLEKNADIFKSKRSRFKSLKREYYLGKQPETTRITMFTELIMMMTLIFRATRASKPRGSLNLFLMMR